MVSHSRIWLWMALLLSAIAADGARGQWRIMAQNAIPRDHNGAIHYKDGIIWAGGNNLVFSTDSGTTWTTSNFTMTSESDPILDIAFLNKDTGMVSTVQTGLFFTTDRGQSWKSIANNEYYRISFFRNSSAINVYGDGNFLTSYDNGLSWSGTILPGLGYAFADAVDGTIYATGFDNNFPGTGKGFLNVSHDFGTTWTAGPLSFDADCWSVDVDSCDPARAYVANENYDWPGNGFSKVYTTADAGQTWGASFSHNTQYLVGSIAASTHAVYIGTLADGILRSTDLGSTWTNIGGPGCFGDCRGIAAISDNIIFALDAAGNIWATFNSGGDSILSTSLSLSTMDVKTDTLGATVAVPITINGLEQPDDVDLVLHYDGAVDYIGSFSPSGAKLDIPGEQWMGRSELSIAGATSGAVAGYAKFNVFNDSNKDAHATFDSVNVPMLSTTCRSSMPEAVTSTITPPSGCGITILSQLIHLGEMPRFTVYPNPAFGNVWISSSGDLDNVTFAIYDMLGVERSEIVASVSKDIPVGLTLPNADGVYNIVVKYSSGMNTIRVVHQQK